MFALISVLRLIKDWLQNEHAILADDVLNEMRKFVDDVNESDYLDLLVLDILQGIREKVCNNLIFT
jgi:hypothetical protein